jgi:hypothetical protein
MAARHKASADGDTAPAPAAAPAGRSFKHRAILIGAAVIALIAGYFILTAFIPRWWSQRVGKAVNGQISTGTVLGICLGLTFTLLPLGVLWFALRSNRSWKTKAVWALVAVVLAAPNIATLGVAVGAGNASHAGQRTMDVDAPAFRGATLAGTLIAVVIFIAVLFMMRRGRAPKTPKPPKTPTPAAAP